MHTSGAHNIHGLHEAIFGCIMSQPFVMLHLILRCSYVHQKITARIWCGEGRAGIFPGKNKEWIFFAENEEREIKGEKYT
jgi:hypothetical protein